MKAILSLFLVASALISAKAQNTSVPPANIPDDEARQKLMFAEYKTKALFKAVEERHLIVAGKKESELNAEIVKLAKEEFGMTEHWHKKIVRAGANTMASYSQDPEDRVIQKDDIVFLDYGPNFDGWETDVGRTYVLGNNEAKVKMKRDVEKASNEAKAWYAKQTSLTGAEFWAYLNKLAKQYGYDFGGEIGGHIIGKFPHEQPDKKGDLSLDIHPGNNESILQLDRNGHRRQWVLEIQFIDKARGFGGFYEQMLN